MVFQAMATRFQWRNLELAMSMRRPALQEEPVAPHFSQGIHVLIVEDQQLFAEALQWVLEALGMQVVGVTTWGEEAMSIARREQPELVLLDVSLPGMSGLSVGKRILHELPETKVVAVTAVANPQTVNKAIRLGFHGYVTLDYPMKQFTASLRAILADQVVIPPQVARATSSELPPDELDALSFASKLTNREREILALLVEGLNNHQIAERLNIAPNTARAHAQRILTKLRVHSRLGAAAYAVRYGLVEPRKWEL
jgi:DNA-binding NarL/FixJ family response regulator